MEHPAFSSADSHVCSTTVLVIHHLNLDLFFGQKKLRRGGLTDMEDEYYLRFFFIRVVPSTDGVQLRKLLRWSSEATF